jgi:hypothetical protein
MKKAPTMLVALTTALALALGAAGCSDEVGATDTSGTTEQTATTIVSDSTTTTGQSSSVASYSEALTVTYDDDDLDAAWDKSSASFITLADGSIRLDGAGGTAGNKKVTITAAGTYVVSGALTDGQIVVDSEEAGIVRLVLNGADITCSTSAPIYVKNAEKVIIVLADGTENSVTDGDSYTLEDSDSGEPNAAIFSKANLTINGTGSLTVTANYNDGITSKDDLKIVSGNITVDAVNDAIKGKDCLGVKDGIVTVTADGDGMQATNDTDAQQGFVDISGGAIDITAGSDGIQAQTTLLVTAGDITLCTGGGSANGETHTQEFGGGGGRGFAGTTESTTTAESATDAESATETESTSAKGLKAGGGVFVAGGTFNIDCADDSIHSNNTAQIDGGTFTIATGDDAVHADVSVTIGGGDVNITKCYEGIESTTITIDDGTIHLVSSDDAVNGVSSTAASTAGQMGQGPGAESGNAQLSINGGYIVLDAAGDGIDINGAAQMTAGTVIVNGPTNDGNSALDHNEFAVSGGTIVAVGSSGMAKGPSEASTQYSVMVNFDAVQAAGTLVHVQDEDGNDVLTFVPTKDFQSMVFSSPDLKEGGTYIVYLGGGATGTVTDGVNSGGTYTPGTETATLTLSSVVTMSGATGGRQGGGMPDGGMPDGGTRPARP